MSYGATVFKVMIASPGDVTAEPLVAREVLEEWNGVHSAHRKIVLLPASWETHSSPEMGDRPQAIINRQVLADSDVLIAIFWTRLGSPTGEHASGTVEEIEEHIGAGKLAMLYFSDAPVHPASVDAEQYEALRAFKQQCMDRGLLNSFSDRTEFREKLYRHLQIKINDHPLFHDVANNNGLTEAAEIQAPIRHDLSEEATTMLKEAAADPHGRVMHLRHMSGSVIQTSRTTLVDGADRREIARWEGAIEELELQGLLQAVGYKGEIYELTRSGYQLADDLSSGSSA